MSLRTRTESVAKLTPSVGVPAASLEMDRLAHVLSVGACVSAHQPNSTADEVTDVEFVSEVNRQVEDMAVDMTIDEKMELRRHALQIFPSKKTKQTAKDSVEIALFSATHKGFSYTEYTKEELQKRIKKSYKMFLQRSDWKRLKDNPSEEKVIIGDTGLNYYVVITIKLERVTMKHKEKDLFSPSTSAFTEFTDFSQVLKNIDKLIKQHVNPNP